LRLHFFNTFGYDFGNVYRLIFFVFVAAVV
jgi:hypothetical protein